MSKTYKLEVTISATAYVEVDAENEEEAVRLATGEAEKQRVEDLKIWETQEEITKVTERCENCAEDKDVDIEPLTDYQGHRLCQDCVDYYNQCPDEFHQIFE